MNKRTYQITYTIIQVVDIDDDEMREYGYEGEITDSDREEYLNNLLADEYDIGIKYDDIDIKEIKEE